MIEEGHLMIGNWVKDTLTGKSVTVGGIHTSGWIYTHDETMDDEKRKIDPEGIPITNGLLEAAGFKMLDDTISGGMRIFEMPFRDVAVFQNYQDNKVFNVGMSHGPRDYFTITTARFVHELQNVIYFLTWTDLKLEL